MKSSSDEKVTAKRLSRKQVVKDKVVAKTTATKKTPRKRAVRKVSRKKEVPDVDKEILVTEKKTLFTEEVKERIEQMETVRKAPTQFGVQHQATKKRKKQFIVVSGLLMFGLGLSAAVGFTDVGQIDVQKTIEDRNERIRTNTTNESDYLASQVTVPVQNTNVGKADGGLIGRGTGGKVLVPKVVSPSETATSTATSSEQTASSTESSSDSIDEIEITEVADEVVSDEFETTDISPEDVDLSEAKATTTSSDI